MLLSHERSPQTARRFNMFQCPHCFAFCNVLRDVLQAQKCSGRHAKAARKQAILRARFGWWAAEPLLSCFRHQNGTSGRGMCCFPKCLDASQDSRIFSWSCSLGGILTSALRHEANRLGGGKRKRHAKTHSSFRTKILTPVNLE